MLYRKEFDLKNTRTNANAGLMEIHQLLIKEKPTFLDYISSGWQLNLSVAIDFTVSNG
jgi:hypothetical protein